MSAQESRAPRVKNRAPAAIQITAEQLLREAQERQETAFRAPKQRVEDYEELHEYQGRKRKEFEDRIRRNRSSMKEWVQYATWEASQNEFARSRSVFERALDVEPTDINLWLRYTEIELKARNVQHARNLFDRAVTLLPRIDQLWYKYVYLEELLQNIPGARQVFERWMKWEPDDKAWQAYIKFEERYEELDRGSAIYERWIAVRPEPRVWVKWGKFEEDRGKIDKAREVFQTALEFFGDDEAQVEKAQAVFAAFARMETRQKEYERARVIYTFALSRLPRSKSQSLYTAYTRFEKQHGDRAGVESTVLGKRRIQYEDEVAADSKNYDTWFDYARLEEDAYRAEVEEDPSYSPEKVRDMYERAVAQVPPGGEKRHWRRYIFLWLGYALFEEIETKDVVRARQIYKTALQLVPHKQFTFAKLWIQYARFEIRQLDLTTARKTLGAAIGMCPKEALFKGYIQLELELREFDRVRTLYEKYLEFDPSNCAAWIKFAELESTLGDYDRTRSIFELAASQPALNMPEVLWKAYIDFEFEEGERDRTRALYERLLEKTAHVKVWVAYALFEAATMENVESEEGHADPERARAVFERGYKALKDKGLKEERVVLLEAWKSFEAGHGTEEQQEKVQNMFPQVTKRWRKVDESGTQEEYWDMVFADDEREAHPASFKFLQMAHAWAKQKQAAPLPVQEDSSEDEDEDEERGQDQEEDEDREDERVAHSASTARRLSPEGDESDDGDD
ncbi:TPR-like protein [Dacryopinax primogenitus]|uniref:Pre-mRNA-splicing factor CLF1 n=1 Tax=Dacryopinax primogenitus (strain DJM 731) TaxID=1858805 RepID=M5FYQ3_DACPD|nr:TPR-like protein [Dacryopinax primogenitus]EJU01644.1 TPR-like protein [Dacryopinax primogenitus]